MPATCWLVVMEWSGVRAIAHMEEEEAHSHGHSSSVSKPPTNKCNGVLHRWCGRCRDGTGIVAANVDHVFSDLHLYNCTLTLPCHPPYTLA